MHPVIGGIEVQDDPLRSFIEGIQELIDQQTVQRHRARTLLCVFKTAERGHPAQLFTFSGKRLPKRIVLELIEVVQFFIAGD